MRRLIWELICREAQNRSTSCAKWNGLTCLFAAVEPENRATSVLLSTKWHGGARSKKPEARSKKDIDVPYSVLGSYRSVFIKDRLTDRSVGKVNFYLSMILCVAQYPMHATAIPISGFLTLRGE